ncbi:HDOD domain-containing protein [Aromatoleum toluclasticum]|uniref:HDOD domain-containing protein n=1 Tax=Aromatoleum toluclasticum TaxID=92003 RepID=UPI001D181CF0|nr:HDOD domain-containing protein [Aromatoleum toluclasticum]MCC4117896.1 HDOD domain-containing protein [Aromatoleum toluclasticum]
MSGPADSKGRRPGEPALFPELQLGVPEDAAEQGVRDPRGLGEWVAFIRDQEMPALGATVALIHSVTEDEKSPTGKLAQAILQDAAMTAKVLKLANSVLYNPTRHGVSTISRAIVVLGFNAVAEIAVAIRVIDALLAGGVRQRVVNEMAHVFHAAVQARALAALRRDGRSEEVFIAALLSRVGEMAFWCFGGKLAQRLDEALSAGQSDDEAQMSVLGFRLRQLSQGLAREWKLGPLLQSVLDGSARAGVSEQAIHFAHRFAVEVENGWDSPGLEKLVCSLAIFAGLSSEAMREELAANSVEAARIAGYFGAAEAGELIPRPAPAVGAPEAGEAEAAEVLAMEPDPQLQLRILREISGRIAAGANLNEILQLVLEGIYRGVGFDRVLFALMSQNRLQLVGKTSLGSGAEALRQAFIFSLDGTPGDLFNEFFRNPRAMRFGPGQTSPEIRLDRLLQVTDAPCACIAPILAQGRPIGLFYADRTHPAEGIDDERFEAFQLFAQQVSLAVTAASSSRQNG